MIPTPERSVRQWEREAQESALRSLERRRARKSRDLTRRQRETWLAIFAGQLIATAILVLVKVLA